MDGIIVTILLAAGAWFSAYHCRKMQKLYSEHSRELSGEVISWEKTRKTYGRWNETCYEMEVLAENGETYHVSSTNRKARKYRQQKDIVLVVPESAFADFDNKYMDDLIMKEMDGTITSDEAAHLSVLRESMDALHEAESRINEVSQRLTVIKEDSKKNGSDYRLSVIMGALLSGFAVICIVAWIMSEFH